MAVIKCYIWPCLLFTYVWAICCVLVVCFVFFSSLQDLSILLHVPCWLKNCEILYILLGVLILLQRKVSPAKLYCCRSTVFRLRFYNGPEFTGQSQVPDASGKQCQKSVFLWEIFLSEYFSQKSHLIWKICSKIHLPSPLEHLSWRILMMVTALIVKTCSVAALIWN